MIILTDLSEVLIRGVYRLENRVESLYGTDVGMEFVVRKHEMQEQFEYLMRGCMTEDKFWRVFLRKGHWPFGVPEIKSLLSQHFSTEIPGTLELYSSIVSYPNTIETSKGKRYGKDRMDGRPEFWLVSDHIAEREEELEYLHPEVFKLISHRIWSYDEVALKKDPAFFHRLLKKNDLRPEEVIFIDDYPENTGSSSKANIDSFWFRNAWQLKHLLIRRGFRFAKND